MCVSVTEMESTLVTPAAPVVPHSVPHGEKPEKFTGTDFKR